eukprot:jgi/Bigna1/80290/fgenesh1_pg.69_\
METSVMSITRKRTARITSFALLFLENIIKVEASRNKIGQSTIIPNGGVFVKDVSNFNPNVQRYDRHPTEERPFSSKDVQHFNFPYIQDGNVFLWESKHGAKMFMCISEKTGSTAWKTLFSNYAAGLEPSAQSHHYWYCEILNFYFSSLIKDLKSELESYDAITHDNPSPFKGSALEALNNPNVPRVVFTRDPIERFVSAYLDKIGRACDPIARKYLHISTGASSESINTKSCSHMMRKFAGLRWEEEKHPPVSIGSFLTQLIAKYEKGYYIEQCDGGDFNLTEGQVFRHMPCHFLPQRQHCFREAKSKRGERSMTFDYQLKVEEIGKWYAPFIRYLDLGAAASHGFEMEFHAKQCCRGSILDPRQAMISHPTDAQDFLSKHVAKEDLKKMIDFLKDDYNFLGNYMTPSIASLLNRVR